MQGKDLRVATPQDHAEWKMLSDFGFDRGDSLTDKFNNLNLKSAEEIERLSVKENISEVDRALALLGTANPTQRAAALASLPALFRDCAIEADEKIIPRIIQIPSKFDKDYQIAVAASLVSILNQRLIPSKTANDTIFPFLLKIIKSREKVYAEEWCDAFVATFQYLTPATLLDKVVALAISFCEPSLPSALRLITCKIIAAIVPLQKGDQSFIEEHCLPVALQRCQDTDYEVRAASAGLLAPILRCVGVQARKTVLQELAELLSDEATSVRRAAFEAFVDLLPAMDQADKRANMMPFLRTCCKSMPEDLTPLFASRLSAILAGLSGCLEEEDVRVIYACYRTLSRFHQSVEIRRLCATNSLSILKHLSKDLNKQLASEVLLFQAKDENVLVRQSFASGLGELLLFLPTLVNGKEMAEVVLKDSNREVRAALLESNGVCAIFQALGSKNNDGSTDVGPQSHNTEGLWTIIASQFCTGLSWRSKEQFFSQLGLISRTPGLIPAEEAITFLESQMVADRTLPVQKAAVASICLVVRYGVSTTQSRRDHIDRLIDRLGRSKTCWDRLLFLHFASAVITVFSRRFFKESVLPSVIDLAKDAVPNVRLKVISLLPLARLAIDPIDDSILMKKWTSSATVLKADKDRDVRAAALLIEQEVEKAAQSELDSLDLTKQIAEDLLFKKEEKLAEEVKRKNQEAHLEFRRKLEQKEQEQANRAKIFGRQKTKVKSPLPDVAIKPPKPKLAMSTISLSPSMKLTRDALPTTLGSSSPPTKMPPLRKNSLTSLVLEKPQAATASTTKTATKSKDDLAKMPPARTLSKDNLLRSSKS